MDSFGSTSLDGARDPAARPTEWQRLRTFYLERARARFDAGEHHVDELRRSKRCELEALRASGIFELVEIQVRRDSCPACSALARREMGLAEALVQEPLPVMGCACRMGAREGFCRCEYVGIVADDRR